MDAFTSTSTSTSTMQSTYYLNKAQTRAIVAFASKDRAREAIYHVAFDAGAIVATDGARLVRAEYAAHPEGVGAPAPTGPLYLVPRGALETAGKAAKARDLIAISCPEPGQWQIDVLRDGVVVSRSGGRATELTFPPYQKVIPRARGCVESARIGVNPLLLADLALISKATERGKGAEISHGGPIDPIVVEWSDPCATIAAWTAIIMPMRI